MTELMDLVGSGRGAVQRELAKLEQGGLATVIKVGNQKHYRANRDSPVFDELCSIIVKTVGLQGPVRDALAPVADKISLALIYGSVAKKTDTVLSDIDLLIVSDGLTLEDVYAALAPTEQLLSRRINPSLYTAGEFERRKKRRSTFITRVLRGPTIHLIWSKNGE